MKIARGMLILFLGLTALMQIVEGVASLADPAGMMTGLGLTMAPGVEVPITFLGLAMLVRGGVTSMALLWVIRRKPEGLVLAFFTALTILLSAPVVYWKLHRPEFAIGDLVQGGDDTPGATVMTPERLRTLFWDTNIERFEPTTYPRYTIERVLEHGDQEAVVWLLRIFTAEDIRATLRTDRRLSPRSATFWALVFGVASEDVAALHTDSSMRHDPAGRAAAGTLQRQIVVSFWKTSSV